MSKSEAKAEAMRYLTNAKEILSEKTKKENGYYSDPKYIKMAGNTFWNGVLVALDYRFPEIKKGKGRTDQSKYRQVIKDGKISKMFDSSYSQLHLVMGYDGVGDEKVVKIAIDNAKQLINWATA
jgi:hypothetical protein